MTLVLSSHDVSLLSRATAALAAPLGPAPEEWWHETSQTLLALFGGNHVICALPGKRLSSGLDAPAVRGLAVLGSELGGTGAEARDLDPLYYRVNAPRTRQPCVVWNRVGSFRRSLHGTRGASRAFEILHAARMSESANVDLNGSFGRAGLCVSYERNADVERSQALMSILASAFGAGVRAAACEQVLVSDSRLTPREREIAALLIARRRNHEIARALGISEHTVRHHVESVCGKLGVHSRDEIAAAVRRGSR